ncbi:MAG: RnfABCDGE type electron transport complex subunit B [Treponema sp.]|nr:RnfABCDGE type electron transport complex subunit B [Treponema sp.]
MNAIFFAVFSVTAIGIISAVALSMASKFMHVKIDERIAQVLDCLPGANCGACGYPGCSGYASALIAEPDVKNNLCTPGGAEAAAKISAILGVEAETVTPKSALVHCGGDCNTRQKKMDYRGIQSCEAAQQLFGGEGACVFGCLGYGDCQKACPSGAICLDAPKRLARVMPNLCTGCGLCVKACPNRLISVENAGIAVAVLCSSIEKGAIVRKKCPDGCIGCGKCVRECPSAAVTIVNNLAVIDYEKCTFCKRCVGACVTGCIQPLAFER